MTTVANIKNLPDLIYQTSTSKGWGPWNWERGLLGYQPGNRRVRLEVSRALGRLRAGEVVTLKRRGEINYVALSPWENQSFART